GFTHGDATKRTATLLLACTALGVTAQASAQSLSRGWDSYRQQQKQQQAGTQGAEAPASSTQQTRVTSPQSADASGTARDGMTTATAPYPVVDTTPAPAYAPPPPRQEEQRLKSGAFIGVQGGQGKVYESIDQDMLALTARYPSRAALRPLLGLVSAVRK
uniref:hypothetical protein n=1 Tax=Pseudomonas viridiflava TaxID=33069 RepID=UPI00197D65CE